MFIGNFTEQPWQDDKTGLMGTQTTNEPMVEANGSAQDAALVESGSTE